MLKKIKVLQRENKRMQQQIINQKMFDEFKKLCEPVRDFMLTYYDLNCTVEITATNAKIVSDVFGTQLKNPENF